MTSTHGDLPSLGDKITQRRHVSRCGLCVKAQKVPRNQLQTAEQAGKDIGLPYGLVGQCERVIEMHVGTASVL